MKREKRKSGRFGSFVLGTFIGFLLCLGALAGLGSFIYFKVSPVWINKTFKTNIDLGNDEINNKTLKDLVTSATGIVKNADTYTLADLKIDFGVEVEDELFGLDITDLKTVGLSDLPKVIENKFASISADELKNINGMDLGDMSTILDKTNTYYFNSADNKLYENFNGSSYSNPVEFDYEVNEAKTKIRTKKHDTQIKMNSDFAIVNQVNIQLWYLPLTTALGGFTSNLGSQMTLQELETDFGVELPSFLNNVDKQNTTINELESAINGLYVADFLGYSVDDSNPSKLIVKDGNDEVSGLMYELAIEKVENLSNIEGKFSELTGADLEDTMNLDSLNKILNRTRIYYLNGVILCEDSSYTTEVDFGYEVKGSNVIINGQEFSISSNRIYVTLKHLPLAMAISEFTSNMGDTLTLRELKTDYGVDLPDYIYNNNENKTINDIQLIIDNIHVADVLGYTINGEIVKNGQTTVTGIMAIIAKKKVSELSDVQSIIEEQTIASLMNFTIDGEVVKYQNGTPVDGLLGKVAKYKINNVGDAVNDLELSDVFSSTQLSEGVFKLLDPATAGSIKVVNVATELKNAMENSSMADLQDAGIIADTYDLEVQIDTNLDGIKDSVLSDMTLNSFLDVAISILSR